MNNYDILRGAEIGDKYARQWKESGKKVLGTYCCHLPEEILYAADIMPFRIRGMGCKDISNAESYMSTFSCSFARATLENFLNGTYDFLDGLVGSDGCMMVQRVYDNWKNISAKDKRALFFHQFNAPRTHAPRAVEFYKMEINELIAELEKFTGNRITDDKLAHAIAVYNETRELIRELYRLRMNENPVVSGSECLNIILAAMSMPKDEFNKQLAAFLEDAKDRAPITGSKARLMLIGSAMDDPEYLKIFEERGGLIVTDFQCFGTRYLWEPVEAEEFRNPVDAIAVSYLSRIVCPRMCDMHHEMTDAIIEMAKAYSVDGIVYAKMRNCDIWGGESTFIDKKVKEAGIPLLILEREQHMLNAGQVGIRAEAFMEMIEGGKA